MRYKLAGKLKDLVEQAIKDRREGKAIENIRPLVFKTVSMNLGPDTAVLIPESAIKPDNTVDFVFTFKALSVGGVREAANTGVNAVFVTCYIKELGSEEHEKRFGNQTFVNNSVARILAYIKEKSGRDVKQGKVGLVGWSGGGGAISCILRSGYTPNSVVVLDGLHSSKDPQTAKRQLDATKRFAELAAKDPANYRFTTVSTGVQPGSYRSTADTSKDIAQSVGMQPGQYNGPGTSPYEVQQNGGAQWIQLYKPNETDVDKMKEQHAHAFWWGAGNNNLNSLLGWEEGQPTPQNTNTSQPAPISVPSPVPSSKPLVPAKPQPILKQSPNLNRLDKLLSEMDNIFKESDKNS